MSHTLQLTVQVHPDRLYRGEPLLCVLAREGIYRSQFETGTSNRGLTAHVGGDRWKWESRMFGGAYDDAPDEVRPKYGALNYRQRPVGGAPRFGSSFLRLKPEVLARTTFCYPDSVFEPQHFATVAKMSLIALAQADRRVPGPRQRAPRRAGGPAPAHLRPVSSRQWPAARPRRFVGNHDELPPA